MPRKFAALALTLLALAAAPAAAPRHDINPALL
jgi:hypothetical protein